MLWLGCGLFLERNWVGVGVVVSFCEKIVLMLLLGCVIRSNCGCGCGWGHSSEVDGCGCPILILLIPGVDNLKNLLIIVLHCLPQYFPQTSS